MMLLIQFLQSVSSRTTWTAWGTRSITVHPQRFTRRLTANKWRHLYKSWGALEVTQCRFQTRNCCSAVQERVICTPLRWVKKTIRCLSQQALGGKGRREIWWQSVVEQACVPCCFTCFELKYPHSFHIHLLSQQPCLWTSLLQGLLGARLYQSQQP